MGTAALIFPVGSILYHLSTCTLWLSFALLLLEPLLLQRLSLSLMPTMCLSCTTPTLTGLEYRPPTPPPPALAVGARGMRTPTTSTVLWCLMLVLLATLDTLRLMLPGLPRVSVVRGRRRLMPTMDMDCMVVMDTTPIAMDTDSPMDMPDGKQ